MNLLDRPKRVYPVLVVLLVGLFALGGVGQNENHGVASVIGAIGWFSFLFVVLLTLVYSLALMIHTRRRRHVA